MRLLPQQTNEKKNSSNWVWFCLFYVILNVMHYLNWLVWHILSTLTTDKSYGIAGSSTRYLLEKETESKWYTRKFQHFFALSLSRWRNNETRQNSNIIQHFLCWRFRCCALYFFYFLLCNRIVRSPLCRLNQTNRSEAKNWAHTITKVWNHKWRKENIKLVVSKQWAKREREPKI